VVVLGLMGAGKSTLASALARRWGRPLRDSDADLSARYGQTAARLAERRGPDGLHDLEAEHLLAALSAGPAPVVAAAASVIERAECRRALGAAAVVWLDVPIDALAARQHRGTHRPAYAEDRAAMLREMDARRRPLFAAAVSAAGPGVVLRPGDGQPVAELVADVERGLSGNAAVHRARPRA
jgi:shikimate kinase